MGAKSILAAGIVLIIILILALSIYSITQKEASLSSQEYNPAINPADFSSEVTNKYFSLEPGKKMAYESITEDGKEVIEVYVTNEKKKVLGIETIVVWDRVWLDGDLIEDTKDWYAQDKQGNVWYFGEESRELANGQVTSSAGSWEAGINNAKPGIIMFSSPKEGTAYRQEYSKGIAEDWGKILSLRETVKVRYGTMEDCIKTRDWNALEPGSNEEKYYCPSVGGVALEINKEDGERVELISLEFNSDPTPSIIKKSGTRHTITDEEAKTIALQKVPGKVTDVSQERKFGKIAYVVEIDANAGPETDVIIDPETGEVLGIEE